MSSVQYQSCNAISLSVPREGNGILDRNEMCSGKPIERAMDEGDELKSYKCRMKNGGSHVINGHESSHSFGWNSREHDITAGRFPPLEHQSPRDRKTRNQSEESRVSSQN